MPNPVKLSMYCPLSHDSGNFLVVASLALRRILKSTERVFYVSFTSEEW
jgi:hypothetical protein